MSSTKTLVSADRAAIVASLLADFEKRLNALPDSALPTGEVTLTHSIVRLEYTNGDAEWMLDDGQIFVTKASGNNFTRPLAPAIPPTVKKIGKIVGTPDDELQGKAVSEVKRMITGALAIVETPLVSKRAPRTLPGLPGKKYSADAVVGSLQKLADSNEKVGL
jgi:hypothetical protein